MLSVINIEVRRFIKLSSSSSTSFINIILEFPELTEDYVQAIRALWRSPTFEEIWNNRSSLQITDTSAIFLDRIEEVRMNYR